MTTCGDVYLYGEQSRNYRKSNAFHVWGRTRGRKAKQLWELAESSRTICYAWPNSWCSIPFRKATSVGKLWVSGTYAWHNVHFVKALQSTARTIVENSREISHLRLHCSTCRSSLSTSVSKLSTSLELSAVCAYFRSSSHRRVIVCVLKLSSSLELSAVCSSFRF